jgi:hypothetical protein
VVGLLRLICGRSKSGIHCVGVWGRSERVGARRAGSRTRCWWHWPSSRSHANPFSFFQSLSLTTATLHYWADPLFFVLEYLDDDESVLNIIKGGSWYIWHNNGGLSTAAYYIIIYILTGACYIVCSRFENWDAWQFTKHLLFRTPPDRPNSSISERECKLYPYTQQNQPLRVHCWGEKLEGLWFPSVLSGPVGREMACQPVCKFPIHCVKPIAWRLSIAVAHP